MEGFRHQGRPVYYNPTPDTYAYQNLYGTVRGTQNGKVRPSLDIDPSQSGGRSKKFNFLPWKKNKSKTDDSFSIGSGTLARHNKYKFGSVSALSSGPLYKDWDSSLSTTPSYSSSDLKHATVRSINSRPRGLVTYPWESYNNNNNESVDYKNNQLNKLENKRFQQPINGDSVKPVTAAPSSLTVCKCQKKKSGPFGTLNLGSMKSSKCNCGFSSVRSSRGFAPPPPPRRRSILPEKVDLYAVHEDHVQIDPRGGDSRPKSENIYDTLSKSAKYRAPKPPTIQPVNFNSKTTSAHSKLTKSLEKCKKDPFSSVASRKSILECDVTAYDLVKNYVKKDISSRADSDLDDDLSDNAIEENNGKDISENLSNGKQPLRKVADKSYNSSSTKSPSPVSSESESGIYSQTSSLRIGGHGMKLFTQLEGNSSPQASSLYSDGSKTNSVDSRTSSWSTSSLSDDGIYSLPEPDYDDDKDSVLTFNNRIYASPVTGVNLRKYSSGGCLTSKASPSHYAAVKNEHYDSPRFSTIRKATSMVSLVSGISGDSGTLKSRVKVPRIPEVPTTTSNALPPPAPPPPPPPPPPSNFSQWKPSQDKDIEQNKEDGTLVKKEKKFHCNNISSSIASELAEKLKSNKPILKKNEIKPKQPMKVNSHNPYAEVKSILKKTGEKLTSVNTNGNSDEASSLETSESSELQDIKKKKRVQFKSLSNESLAVEQIHNETLSSSDEEWEEARDTFSNSTSKNTSANSELRRKKNDEDFQTVEEYLKSQKDDGIVGSKISQTKSNGEKNDIKTNSRISAIPRPSQPPPPPPNIRKGNGKGPPPPRPLSTTPKSFSHSDLRVASSIRPSPQKNLIRAGLVKTSGSEPLRPGQQASLLNHNPSRLRVPVEVNSTISDSSNISILPKNGVSSPAASPEATTSSRGKSLSITGDNSLSPEGLCCLDINSGESLVPLTAADDSSSESSYMSLPRIPSPENNNTQISDADELLSLTETSLDSGSSDAQPLSGTEKEELKSRQINFERPTITCTIVNKPSEEICNSNLLKTPSNSLTEEMTPSQNCDEVREQKNSMLTTSCGTHGSLLIPEIEGPVYSKLLYVSRKSPSPPPLPITLPPLPPKRNSNTQIIKTNSKPSTVPDSVSDEDAFYDVLPVRSAPKSCDSGHSIYESRRYSDTGATVVTISSGASDSISEHIYFSLESDSIYEELPDVKESTTIYVSPNPFGRHRRSFFEGASKAEILKFLEGAKDRVVDQLEEDILDEDENELSQAKNARNNPIRISNISSSSDSSTISSNSNTSRECSSSDETSSIKKCRILGGVEVERADSGVGSETSKPSVLRRKKPNTEELCADCDQLLETEQQDNLNCCPLVCEKCDKKRSERKEIVTEIVETEFKYGKDLLIIKEEFKTPMEVAGLLTKEQINGIFINLDELILVNAYFSEKLKDATDIATEQGDEDYTTVNIGKLFLETTTMLRAFEVYCIRQGTASVLLTNLEKEKELLRIFLRVSQMENPLLRRMNLSAFLMVPVQRVTKYPLLLSRLYKVTPYHHKDREALREAQLKIELHLEQINQQTKGITGTKIWRRISNISASHRRSTNVSDIGSIQLRKMAMEVLEWSKEDIRFVMAGKLAFSGAIDFTKSRRGRAVKFSSSHALLATKGKPNSNYRPDLAQDSGILFPRNTGIEDATLLLMKEKNGRYSLARDPLHLGICVISTELEDEDIIEIQEYTTKESIFLKAECKTDTVEWLKQLRYHAKDLGAWKRRRNALANIMINGMFRQQ